MAVIPGLKESAPLFMQKRQIYDAVETETEIILSPSFALVYVWLYTYGIIEDPANPLLNENKETQEKPIVFYTYVPQDNTMKEERIEYPQTYILLLLIKHFGNVSSVAKLCLYSRYRNNNPHIRTTNSFLKDYLRTLGIWETQREDNYSFFYSVYPNLDDTAQLIYLFGNVLKNIIIDKLKSNNKGYHSYYSQLPAPLDRRLFFFHSSKNNEYHAYALEAQEKRGRLNGLTVSDILNKMMNEKEKHLKNQSELNEQTKEIICKHVPQHILYGLSKEENRSYINTNIGWRSLASSFFEISKRYLMNLNDTFVDKVLEQLNFSVKHDDIFSSTSFYLIDKPTISLPKTLALIEV